MTGLAPRDRSKTESLQALVAHAPGKPRAIQVVGLEVRAGCTSLLKIESVNHIIACLQTLVIKRPTPAGHGTAGDNSTRDASCVA